MKYDNDGPKSLNPFSTICEKFPVAIFILPLYCFPKHFNRKLLTKFEA